MTIDQAMQVAISQRQSGQLAAAEAGLRQILAAQPNHGEATHQLALLASQAGRTDIAVELFRRAIALQPNDIKAYNNLAYILSDLDQLDEAVDLCHRALAIDPRSVAVYNNLGNALLKQNRTPEALATFDQALLLDPNHAIVHNNRGMALANLGELEQALAAYRRALEIDPKLAMAYTNLGKELTSLQRFDEAIAAHRAGLRLQPDHPVIHWHLSHTMLTFGNFLEGWEEYEWGNKIVAPGRQWEQTGRKWSGQDLRGKTLLLHCEAGFGDSLQFVRYVPLLQDLGAQIILECKPQLTQLFSELEGLQAVIPHGQTLPEFDFHISLPHLPRIFKTDLTNIPNRVPYLKVPGHTLERWRPRIRGDALKIGLVWTGATHSRAPLKYRMAASALFPALAQVKNVQYYSLQKDPVSSDPPPTGINMIDFTAEMHDFSDTAAVIELLDMVISIDTAAAHLAGALARPAWVFLPFSADFRWLTNRDDSPWYPTMRLFRQETPHDVHGSAQRVVAALKELTR